VAQQIETGIRDGTSAFAATDWDGTFYPAGMQLRDFLSLSEQPLCWPCSCHGHAVPGALGKAEQENLTPPAFVAAYWI
jgi:hypothetical protein